MLPPETRLSWIAALLPYFGHPDWHRQVDAGYSWNSAQNSPVTRRLLPEVVNPLLGPARTAAGFPVTHYVGVAGVGADAGRLKVDDPRAGVFGYGRGSRPQDITRGTSNAIAVLGVTEHCGAWAAGGDGSVRRADAAALRERPGRLRQRAAGRHVGRHGRRRRSASSPRTSIPTCWSSWPRSTAATK